MMTEQKRDRSVSTPLTIKPSFSATKCMFYIFILYILVMMFAVIRLDCKDNKNPNSSSTISLKKESGLSFFRSADWGSNPVGIMGSFLGFFCEMRASQ